jgi:hypothetical protein
MGHGLSLVRASVVLGVGVLVFAPQARSGHPLDDRLGVRTAPIFLLDRADVQRDLGLEGAQASEIRRKAVELYRRAQVLKGSKASGVVPARRVIDDDASQWITANLAPKQRERLAQIELQWEGATALITRPLVGEYLNLTPEQHKKVARFVADARAAQSPGPWDYEGHVALERKAIGLLTEKQREQWIQLLGPPCHFSLTSRSSRPAGPQPPPVAAAPSGRLSSPGVTRRLSQ